MQEGKQNEAKNEVRGKEMERVTVLITINTLSFQSIVTLT